jgi:Zn-dependent M16 (insulinase) family peptidase
LVLCGSNKYPVRDPFFKMINRSLNSFMNAMTGTDYTMYPFQTGNETDFQNLLSVYLDAVFRPNLRYIDFLQEAWRLGEGNHGDEDGNELIFKGITNFSLNIFSNI